MKFRDYAANETSLMASRLLAKRSKKSLSELDALRRALDEAMKSFEASVNAWAKVEQDEEIPDVSERLTKAATAQAQALVQAAKSEADSAIAAARAELEARSKDQEAKIEAKFESRIKEAESKADARVKDQENKIREHEARIKDYEAKAKEYDRASNALRTELAEQKERADGAFAELRKADDAKTALQQKAQELHNTLEATRADSGRLVKKLEAEGAEKKKLLAAVEAAKVALRTAEEQRQGVAKELAERASRIESLEKASAEHDKRRAEFDSRVEAARVEAQSAARNAAQAGTVLTRLSEMIEKMTACTTTADILTTLADGLAEDFGRVALFSVRAKKFEGLYQVGSSLESDISKIVIPITMHPLMSKAVASGRVEWLETSKSAKSGQRVPFGGSPGCSVAVPVTVHGDTLAVIHADDPEPTQGEGVPGQRRADFAEILQRFAIASLDKLVLTPKLAGELRSYATSLIDEIESVYSADVRAGKADAQVETRLESNLQCAREMYSRRTEGEVDAAASLFEERLASIVAERSSTKFGQAMAAMIKRHAKSGSSHAQAS